MGRDRTLRVLTLNCWNVSEPFAERMAIIRRGLTTLAPDVAAFQEIIVRRGELEQPALLKEENGHFRVFGPAFGWSEDGTPLAHDQATSGFGNLIVSRWPILRAEVRLLPGREGDEPRTVMGALVETPGGILPVMTTHLDWELDHGWVREQQVQAVDDFARDLAPAGDLPAVLMGDFNASPDSTEMRFLRGLASIDGRSTYFQDAWELGGPGGAGLTWNNRNPFASRSGEPDRRIDYVLVRPPDTDGRGRITASRLVFDEPVDGTFASDHFGVLADILV